VILRSSPELSIRRGRDGGRASGETRRPARWGDSWTSKRWRAPLNSGNFIDLTSCESHTQEPGIAASTVGCGSAAMGLRCASNNYLLDGALMTT